MKKMVISVYFGLLVSPVTHLVPVRCTTPLYDAAARGRIHEVSLCCKHQDIDLNLGEYNPFRGITGARVRAGEEDRDVSPLEIALRNNNLMVAEFLRKRGAKPVNTGHTKEPLSFQHAVIGGDVALVRDYLARDPKLLNELCTQHYGVFDSAVYIGDLDVIDVLVEYGLDLSEKFGAGKTNCLQKALKYGNIDLAEYFIRCGSNIDVDKEIGCPPLVNTITTQDIPMAQMLLEKGASTKKVIQNDGSALLHAAHRLRSIEQDIGELQNDLNDVLPNSAEAASIREDIQSYQEDARPAAQEMIGMLMFHGERVSDRELEVLDRQVYDEALRNWKAKERKRVVSLPRFFQQELGMNYKQRNSGAVRRIFFPRPQKRKCGEMEDENTAPPNKRRAT